jgi:2-methylisoborneol synthase
MAAFEKQKHDLMMCATPELTLYLVGLEAWIAGNREWHFGSARYEEGRSAEERR